MTANVRSSKFLLFVWLFVMACMFCSMLHGWFPFTQRTWIFSVLGVMVSLYLSSHFYVTKYFLCLVVYALVVWFNFQTGDVYFKTSVDVLTEIAIFLFPMAIAYYIAQSGNNRFCNAVVVIFFAMIGIASIGTPIAETMHPGIVRISTISMRDGRYDPVAVGMMRIGMTDYSLPHALPLLVPPLVCFFKKKELKKIYRALCLVVIVASFSVVFYSGAAAPLILFAAILVVSAFTIPGDNTKSLRRVLVLSVLFVIIWSISERIGSGLIQLSSRMESSGASAIITTRFEEVGEFLLTGEQTGDLEARTDLYNITSEAIMQSPLVGVNAKVGGHQGLLDRFAVLGLIGFIPLIGMFYLQYKQSNRLVNKDNRFFFFESIVTAIIMMSSKNMVNDIMLMYMFVVVPATFICLQSLLPRYQQ